MSMTPLKLILLRIYNLTLGRIPFFSMWIKKILVYFLISKAKDKYVASSNYFDYKQFEQESTNVR